MLALITSFYHYGSYLGGNNDRKWDKALARCVCGDYHFETNLTSKLLSHCCCYVDFVYWFDDITTEEGMLYLEREIEIKF